MIAPVEAYSADRSLKGKVRRRWARVVHRRPLSAKIERPIVSVTFDDAPASAVETGATILEAHGTRGTFYISAGLDGRDGPMGRYGEMAAYRGLAERGHEIACHTYSHLDCGQASTSDMQADLDRNAEIFADAGIRADSFAYPYGDVSPAAKALMQVRFGSLRALHPGLIQAGVDLNQLPAVGIEGASGETTARGWLERALRQKAWLILYTHDVRADASDWGCTPQALERLLAQARAGGADILPVNAAIRSLTATP